MAQRNTTTTCGSRLGAGWIDTGTMCLARSAPPGSCGLYEQLAPHVAFARGFMFVVFEQLPEVGTGRIIRKVAAIPRDFSLTPKNPFGTLSPGEHARGSNLAQSPYLSASTRPFGAPSIKGQPLLLDTAKILKAGGRIYSVAEVVRDLQEFAAKHPSARTHIDNLMWTIQKVEGEVLIKGSTPPGSARVPGAAHSAYIRSAEEFWGDYEGRRIGKQALEQELVNLERSYARARVVGNVGRAFMVVGVVVTAADLTRAAGQSIEQQSFKPIGAETLRQAGGWGAAIAGAKIGATTGALLGVTTGPGAIVTGAVGAIVFGAAGYFGADWLADHISPN